MVFATGHVGVIIFNRDLLRDHKPNRVAKNLLNVCARVHMRERAGPTRICTRRARAQKHANAQRLACPSIIMMLTFFLKMGQLPHDPVPSFEVQPDCVVILFAEWSWLLHIRFSPGIATFK